MTTPAEKIEKRLSYMSVKFVDCDINDVYHHLSLNYKVSDFIIALDKDNNTVIGEIFTSKRTKIKGPAPRFLKLGGGGQGIIILDKSEQYTLDYIMSIDPMYLVKGNKYKPSNAAPPLLNEVHGELTRTINTEEHSELEETIDRQERELKNKDVIIEKLNDDLNDEIRKKMEEIEILRVNHNLVVDDMEREISEKNVLIEKLREEIEVLKTKILVEPETPSPLLSHSKRDQLMKKPIPYLKIMVKKKYNDMFTEEFYNEMSLEDLVDILDE